MATRATKENDLMTDANIERVIALLEPAEGTKPGSKKDACAILGIAYNTTRLGTLIEKYKENKARVTAKRESLRGKPETQDEIVFIIAEYLEGGAIDSISKSTYRSSGLVKKVLEDHSVPIRQASADYFKPELIPEGASRTRFSLGEIVYSARYDSLARVDTETFTEKYGYIYRIWLLSDKWKQNANTEAYELASLEHLRKLGVRV
jgi:hypothetical protein